MILSDLLNRPVLDDSGTQVGHVVDLRFVLDGTPSQLLAGAVLHSILVSPRTGSSFLGYERSNVSAPWPIGALLKRRHRGSFFVAWSDIAVVSAGAVTLRTGYSRLPLRE